MIGKPCCVIAVILSLFFFYIGPPKIYAFTAKDDYLWIEFREQIKEKNGSLTRPLEIGYGRFPEKRKDISELEDLRAFYTLAEKDDDGKRIFYEAEIEKTGGKCLVRISAFKAERFIVLVEGKKIQGKDIHHYLAKTSFILYGHCPSERKKTKPIPPNEINRRFEMCTTPEFLHWPQTDNPVKITILFNQKLLEDRPIFILDENLGIIEATTDETANYTYIPQEDKKLNLQGMTASKHAIIVARESKGNTNYISSHTLLLHRNRFKNRRLTLGAGIFGGVMAGVFLVVAAKRRRFKI
jgi:hypothetical protein